MPIAKLRSADGDVSIYYELHGATQTARDDFSYSKAGALRGRPAGPTNLNTPTS